MAANAKPIMRNMRRRCHSRWRMQMPGSVGMTTANRSFQSTSAQARAMMLPPGGPAGQAHNNRTAADLQTRRKHHDAIDTHSRARERGADDGARPDRGRAQERRKDSG